MTTKHSTPRGRRAVTTFLLAAAAMAALTESAAATTAGGSAAKHARCDQGEFCTWSAAFYRGAIHRVDLRTANPGECIPLPDNTDGRSFANRTSRDITVYQGRDCSTEGDFTTYPGRGTYVPDAPYVVRAFQLWD